VTALPKYPKQIFWSEEDEGFIAIAPDLPGCSAFGVTEAEALRELDDATESWIDAAAKAGNTVPAPSRPAAPAQHSGRPLQNLARRPNWSKDGRVRNPDQLERPMKEPGLDGRHRDKDGEIQRKRSDTLNKNLSKPIPQFSPSTTLGEMRKKTGKESENDVRRAAAKLKK
jgi:predicted RNase H-like HicB family nuclease